MLMHHLKVSLSAAVAILALAATASSAQEAAEFYKGKIINMVIGSDVGGGYDAYARLVARHLGSHIPGRPSIVPVNMPGAAQTKAGAYIYSLAAKDGTQIGALSPFALLVPVLGGPKIQYDANKFQYLGSANSETYICIVRPDAAVKTFADVFEHELIVGSSGGSSTLMMPLLLKNLLQAKLKMVRGYRGTKDMQLAMERNEIQGICGLGYASFRMEHGDWLDQGKVKILVQESSVHTPDIDRLGVPLATDFARTEEERTIMDLAYSQEIFGRPYVLAPEVPQDRVALLRRAFIETLADPELLKEAATQHLDIVALSGEEVQKLVAKVYTTPPAVMKRARDVLEVESQ